MSHVADLLSLLSRLTRFVICTVSQYHFVISNVSRSDFVISAVCLQYFLYLCCLNAVFIISSVSSIWYLLSPLSHTCIAVGALLTLFHSCVCLNHYSSWSWSGLDTEPLPLGPPPLHLGNAQRGSRTLRIRKMLAAVLPQRGEFYRKDVQWEGRSGKWRCGVFADKEDPESFQDNHQDNHTAYRWDQASVPS